MSWVLFYRRLWYVNKVILANKKKRKNYAVMSFPALWHVRIHPVCRKGKGKVTDMKKKGVLLLLGIMMTVSMTACGGDKNQDNGEATEIVETTETAEESRKTDVVAASSAFDLNASDYVELCDYSAIEAVITGDYEVTDADVKEYLEQMFNAYGPFYRADPDKTTVAEGDIVNVDYVGTLNGEAFEGGTAENQNIDVYGNCAAGGATGYIEGFTEGLKTAAVGDVIDCDVTFPEDYGSTELAGKEVVFTFTVNSIQKEMTIDDVDDAFAKEQFETDTVEEMYEQIRSYLEMTAEYNKESDTYKALQTYLVDNSKVEVPQDYLEARVADYKRQFIEGSCGGDASQLESYLNTYYGKTEEEMDASWKEGMESSIGLEFIMATIAEELDITVDEAEYEEYIQNVATNSGYESVEAMYELYGYGDAVYGEKYVKNLYRYDRALDKVLETAIVTVQEPAEDTEEVSESNEVVTEDTQAE